MFEFVSSTLGPVLGFFVVVLVLSFLIVSIAWTYDKTVELVRKYHR